MPPVPSPPDHALTRGMMALIVLTAFVTAVAMHLQTPVLPEFGPEFGATAVEIGWVPTLTFAGFFSGSMLLVPLGDRIDKRWLILGKLSVLILAVIAMAMAPSLAVLCAASFVVGACSSVSQDIIPLVTDLVPGNQRGKAVGTVLSGVFMGLMVARVGGGFAAGQIGWRATYLLEAALLAPVVLALAARVPRSAPKTNLAYGALMRSVVRLLFDRVELRRASGAQFLLGICYGGFWATIAPMLADLHGLGPAKAGLIGIPGAAGILIARASGRWMDRRGARPVVMTGAALIMIAYAVFALGVLTVAAVVVGAAVLDCGLRAAMVANQALVTGMDPDARSRANTIFAMSVWGGNATGALVASLALAYLGWLGVCAVGFAAALVALLIARLPAPRVATQSRSD